MRRFCGQSDHQGPRRNPQKTPNSRRARMSQPGRRENAAIAGADATGRVSVPSIRRTKGYIDPPAMVPRDQRRTVTPNGSIPRPRASSPPPKLMITRMARLWPMSKLKVVPMEVRPIGARSRSMAKRWRSARSAQKSEATVKLCLERGGSRALPPDHGRDMDIAVAEERRHDHRHPRHLSSRNPAACRAQPLPADARPSQPKTRPRHSAEKAKTSSTTKPRPRSLSRSPAAGKGAFAKEQAMDEALPRPRQWIRWRVPGATPLFTRLDPKIAPRCPAPRGLTTYPSTAGGAPRHQCMRYGRRSEPRSAHPRAGDEGLGAGILARQPSDGTSAVSLDHIHPAGGDGRPRSPSPWAADRYSSGTRTTHSDPGRGGIMFGLSPQE